VTKARGLALCAGRDHGADLDVTLGDDHAGHQALDQLALLFPGCLTEPLTNTPAERIHAQPNTGGLGPAIRLHFQLAQLGLESLPFLIQIAAPAPQLVQTCS